LPKITAQSENHGNHGDREFMIYIYIMPYKLNLAKRMISEKESKILRIIILLYV